MKTSELTTSKRLLALAYAVAVGGLSMSAGCNTIKGLLGGEDDTPVTEAEPAEQPTASETSEAEVAATASAEPETSAAPEPSAEAAAITAINEAEVKRFDDEEKLEAPADSKVKNRAATVIKEPPAGELVAVLKPDTELKVLSSREGFSLVAFDNPENADEQLMGWIKTDGVEAVPAATTAAPAEPTPDCVPGQSKVLIGSNEKCAVVCTSNTGCPTGKICSGRGALSNNGVAGDPVKFCATTVATPVPKKPSKPPATPDPPKKKKKKKKKKAD